MNDFGSNNLVPHVHVVYLNVGTKWMKNKLGDQLDTSLNPPSMANGQTNSTIVISNASRS